MYDVMPSPRVKTRAGAESKALDSNVAAVAPATRGFRAVVERNIRQTAVVEFDAPEGADRWTLGDEIVALVPADAWVSADPSGGWVQDMESID